MIQNLLFDLGGVIMDIKRDNCIEALKLLGMPDPSRFLGDYAQTGVFGDLESGLITPDEFRAFIRSQVSVPLTDQQIDSAFCKFLIGIPVKRLRQLQLLRQNYGIYMLSNTNQIMWDATIADEFCKDGLSRDAYFDGIVTSFEAKCLKPGAAIFQCVIDRYGIRPEETLFLDDSKANLTGAEALGFRTAHIAPGTEFIDVLHNLDLC